MNKQQFNKTIETVINSPRSDLQKIGMLQNAFALYVKEETDRIVAELEDKFERTVAEILDKTGSDFTIADFNVKRYSDRICEIVRKGGTT